MFGCLVILASGDVCAGETVLFKGIVNSYKLNIRKTPSQYSDVVVVVEKGEPVDVVEEKGGIGGWLTVVYKGKRGYIRNRSQYILLKPVAGAKKSTAPKAKTAGPGKAAAPKVAVKDKIDLTDKIVTEEQKLEKFSIKESEIIEGLDEIDYGLNQARLKSVRLSREAGALAARNTKIREDQKILAVKIEEDQAYAGQRLNALYRMGMIGRLDIAGLPSSVFDFFLTQNAMKQVIASDLVVLETQAQDLKKLNALEEELSRQVTEKNNLEAELNLQIRIKEKETLKKEAILYEIQRKKKLSLAALESLKSSARDLDEKMSTMGEQILHPIENSSFSHQKGRLSIPVNGKIISTFGPSKNGDYKSFTFQSGIDITVERGEPVRSVFKGEVIFSQWLKGYGNMLIINHGDNYYTLYAHVEEVFKKKGEAVDTGEVIATAGDTGSIKGLYLHFEVRHHGKPVNPMQWLRKGV
ncbi:MAG: peptidoglycan DD-metalloendopeptidase family protein [Proteobacteria bacterium]|nr:peptidoglycan DD-metalloendopeptidase family protein [Pseudomonadota bacterium]